jgi:subtilisin family serine protease
MTLDRTRLLLAFREKHAPEDVEKLLARVGLTLEDAGAERENGATSLAPRINHTETRFWVRSRRGQLGDEQLDAIEQTLERELRWIGPVYRLPDGDEPRAYLCPLPDALVVAPVVPADNGSESVLADVLGRHGLEEVPKKSRYLGKFRYFQVTEPRQSSAYALRDVLLEKERGVVRDARFENMPMTVPVAATIPNDTLFAQQWGMTRINAPAAWDISAGVGTVVACVLDEGCDLGHPDLTFSTPGINLGTMLPDGSPTGSHGTACAGIVAGHFNNTLGVAGVAGQCQIMPIAFSAWTDVEVAMGINYAANHGARVISMSFGWNPWDHAIIDPAIQHAFDSDVVMCVATHNYNGPITYPATNPLVMACGASDQVDNRKTPQSPDLEGWGSDFGPRMSVVAPGVRIPTTDRQGTAGYNTAAGTAGDYVLTFNGTSSATPHVAGLAALLRSQYPTLTNVQVRAIIERTADRVGTVGYAEVAGYPNGTWNQQMGYGRINAYRALDGADVLIRDWPGDTGAEPSSSPGDDYWDFSDIVVRNSDDGVFDPSDWNGARNVERGQTNYVYVRVTNNGPRDARNVLVTARITPWVGLQFVYPDDWTLADAQHVSPAALTTSFASILAGTSVIAKFTVSASQVEQLWGWIANSGWHPCLLARVQADNDYGFAGINPIGPNVAPKRNNLAQRNLTVVDVLAGATAAFPMVAGHLRNAERVLELVIDRSELPKEVELLLSLDEDGRAFPLVDFRRGESAPDDEDAADYRTIFLDRTRLDTTLGGCRGILTLKKGSRFDMRPHHGTGSVKVVGGEVILRDNRRFVLVREAQAKISLTKRPYELVPLALRATISDDSRHGAKYTIRVAQQNQRGERVGGATVIWTVNGG